MLSTDSYSFEALSILRNSFSQTTKKIEMKRFFTHACIVILLILAAVNSSAQSVSSISSEKSRSKAVNETGSKVEMHSFDLAQTANTVKINWQTSTGNQA